MAETEEVQEIFEFPQMTERFEYRHVFSQQELLELGEKLNNQLREKNQLEADKKSAMSSFKSRIDSKDAELGLTGGLLKDKYEIKPVDAVKKINPFTLRFELYHPETSELLDERGLRSDEIKKYFPSRKNIAKKQVEWYNPYQPDQVVETRKMSSDEILDATQLKIEEGPQEPW